MRYNIGDCVFTYLGRVERPFRCKIVEIRSREVGIFRKHKEEFYVLQIPEQEWVFEGNDNPYSNLFVSKTQSGLINP